MPKRQPCRRANSDLEPLGHRPIGQPVGIQHLVDQLLGERAGGEGADADNVPAFFGGARLLGSNMRRFVSRRKCVPDRLVFWMNDRSIRSELRGAK